MNHENTDSSTIQTSFMQSWLRTEQLFSVFINVGRPSSHRLKRISELMHSLRKQGYDKKLRAGHMLHLFILSRSEYHGLRPDQAYISFATHHLERGMHVVFGKGNETIVELRQATIEITPQIEALLNKLIKQPID